MENVVEERVICNICYPNKTSYKHPEKDECTEGHAWTFTKKTVFVNSKILMNVRDPPRIGRNSAFVLCRYGKAGCTKRFCSFAHSEEEKIYWEYKRNKDLAEATANGKLQSGNNSAPTVARQTSTTSTDSTTTSPPATNWDEQAWKQEGLNVDQLSKLGSKTLSGELPETSGSLDSARQSTSTSTSPALSSFMQGPISSTVGNAVASGRNGSPSFSNMVANFQNLSASDLPQDPNSWTRDDVARWLDAEEGFEHKPVFAKYNGQRLCRLTERQFIELCGKGDGILLYNALQDHVTRSQNRRTTRPPATQTWTQALLFQSDVWGQPANNSAFSAFGSSSSGGQSNQGAFGSGALLGTPQQPQGQQQAQSTSQNIGGVDSIFDGYLANSMGNVGEKEFVSKVVPKSGFPGQR
eukprot:Colp12_sorted_trinity150504_noHs@27177